MLRIALALTLLAACTGGTNPAPVAAAAFGAAPEGAPPARADLQGERTPLTLWLASDYVNAKVFAELNRDFQRVYPGVAIKLLGVPWGNIPTKLKTAVLGGNPPDVVQQHAAALGAQGFALPVDDLWEKWRASDPLGRDDSFLPGAIDEVTWAGRRFGIPLDINCTLILFNKDSFDRAGLPYPGEGYTFERMLVDLRKLNHPPEQYAIGLTSNAWHSYAFVRAAGGEVLNDQGTRVAATLSSKGTVKALRFLGQLAKEGLGPLPSTREGDFQDASRLFMQGKIALFYTGPWDFRQITDEAPQIRWGATRFPKFEGHAEATGSVQGGGSLFVPKGSPRRELAFEWMKWASSPRYGSLMVRELGRHPVRAKLYEDPMYEGEAMQAFVQALPHARPYKLEAFPVADQAFADAVKASLYGEDPAQALTKAQQRAQWFIDLVEGQ